VTIQVSSIGSDKKACSFSGKELKNVSTNQTSGWPFRNSSFTAVLHFTVTMESYNLYLNIYRRKQIFLTENKPKIFIIHLSDKKACSFSGKELKNVSTNQTSGWPF
jgi:hypothetical protein